MVLDLSRTFSSSSAAGTKGCLDLSSRCCVVGGKLCDIALLYGLLQIDFRIRHYEPFRATNKIVHCSGEPDVVADVGADERKATLTGLRPSTEYEVVVQPYNRVGLARPSIPAHVTTQDGISNFIIL